MMTLGYFKLALTLKIASISKLENSGLVELIQLLITTLLRNFSVLECDNLTGISSIFFTPSFPPQYCLNQYTLSLDPSFLVSLFLIHDT